jgi:hypothetical protein
MKKLFIILCAMVPVFLLAQNNLNLKVIEADEARSLNIPDQYVNANGKALITEDYYQQMKNGDAANDFFIEIDGWPILEISGTTSRASRFIDIDLDDKRELIFTTGSSIQVYSPAGEIKEGFPVSIGTDPVEGAPVVGNIDGDPELEIVVHSTYYGIRGGLYAFNHDGTLVSGFPIEWDFGGPQKEPLLVNIDGDPQLEIISAVYDYPLARVFAHNGDGTLDEDWENVVLDYIPGTGASAGDLDGDGVPEIITCSYWKLYVWNIKAEPLEGFPFTFEQDVRSVSYSNPVIVDLDQDGNNDIVVPTCNEQPQTDAGAVFVVKNDGTIMDGWPQYTNYWMFAPASVVDIDQNGNLDILVGDQVLSPNPTNRLNGWNFDGSVLSGFPVGSLDAINIQGTVSDLDGNGDLEIICDNNATNLPYQIVNHDGSIFEGLLNPPGATFFNQVLLADINDDGNLNLVAPTVSFQTFTTDMHIYDAEVPYDPELTPLSVLQYNSRNTGEYGTYDPVTSVPETLELHETELEIYPNPFLNSINFNGIDSSLENGTFQLFDQLGEEVMTAQLKLNGSAEVEVGNNLPQGIYIYKLKAGNKIYSGKIAH